MRREDKQLEHFVIVDPYSSGIYLVQEFRSQGIRLIGVQSSQELAQFWLDQYDESLFEETIKHESMEKTIAALKEYNIVACIPGSEPGVYLSEDIQEELQLKKRNGADTKDWRRHKFHQQARLHECGIRSIRQTYAATVEECLAWQRQWGKWPIIVKPAESGGTDGVYWCHCEEDCHIAFRNECSKINVNGMVNEKLLCQEFLDGKEYIIDCVSDEGRHVLNGVWVYDKVYDAETKSISYLSGYLLEATGEVQDKLVEYIFKVLTALGIKYGATHSEAIIVDGEPCLVETGARMQGLKGPKLTEMATGFGVYELVVDVYAYGGRLFKELVARDYRYLLKNAAGFQFLNNTVSEGILAKDVNLDLVKSLPSVRDAHVTLRKGDRLNYTRDIKTSPGYMIQVHPRKEQLIADAKVLRDLESSAGFYEVITESDRSGPEMRETDLSSTEISSRRSSTASPESPYCPYSCASPRRSQIKSYSSAPHGAFTPDDVLHQDLQINPSGLRVSDLCE